MDIPPAAVPAPSPSACEMENLPEEFLTLWKKEESVEDEEDREADDDEFSLEMEKRWQQVEERSKKEEDPDQEEFADLGKLCSAFAEQEETRDHAFVEQEKILEQEERRVGWKPSEMDLFMDLSVLLMERKMDELEELYAKKLALMQAEEEGVDPHLMPPLLIQECEKLYDKNPALKEAGKEVPGPYSMAIRTRIRQGVDWKSMAYFKKHFPNYFSARYEWSEANPNLVFEDITNILPMRYTNQGVPRYVYEHQSNSLQIYSVKVGGKGKWPLDVFGIVAVRDTVDPKRNLIFNQHRDYCQTLTKENPFLVLTGPTRAVVMNGPVSIEAELKVKGACESEDKYLFAASSKVQVMSGLGLVELDGYPSGRKLKIAVGGLGTSVEATIFVQVIDGIWPAGFHGQFAARTTSTHKKIILSSLLNLVMM
ncbi:unnamed protein product [Urochloa humidicola]